MYSSHHLPLKYNTLHKDTKNRKVAVLNKKRDMSLQMGKNHENFPFRLGHIASLRFIRQSSPRASFVDSLTA